MAEEEKKSEGAAAEPEKPAAEQPEATPEQPKAEAKSAEEAKTVEKPAEEAKPAGKPAEPAIDWKDRYARLLADFDNFKKRTARDREDTFRYAEADVLEDVLPTVDNLALALANAKNPDDDFVKGVRLVYDGLLKALKDHGAEPFDCIGKELDTERMEAIAHLPSADVPEGKVSIESRRGWTLKGKVLRAAQVVVSAGQPA